MKSSNFTFKDKYGVEIFVYKWEPDKTESIKASILLLHGLTGHGGRYREFAETLTNAGYICYVGDYRGHGKTAGDIFELGKMGPGKSDGLEDDITILLNIIRKENPNIPLFSYGHSFGSILLQVIMQKYGKELKGVILSATTGKQDFLLIFKLIAKSEVKKVGYDNPSEKLNNLILRSNNKPFKKNAKTLFDWLTRDEEEVKKYIEDPFCGFVLTAGFCYELAFNPNYPWTKEKEAQIPKNLPIFFVAGERDSLSKNTKKIKSLMRRYKKLGISDISFKFYPEARHELYKELRETREEFFQDVINWLDSKL